MSQHWLLGDMWRCNDVWQEYGTSIICAFVTGYNISNRNYSSLFLYTNIDQSSIITLLNNHFSFIVTSGMPQGSNFGLHSCIVTINVITLIFISTNENLTLYTNNKHCKEV